MIGILGLGNIRKEVAKRAMEFGLEVIVYDKYIDIEFIKNYPIGTTNNIADLISVSYIISMNISLNEETAILLSTEKVKQCKKGVIVINTARAGLISNELIIS